MGKWLMKMSLAPRNVNLEREVFGIHFTNTIGVAAGFDPNGDHLDELAAAGFGFVPWARWSRVELEVPSLAAGVTRVAVGLFRCLGILYNLNPFYFYFQIWGKKWQPDPVFLPGKFHGRRSLVGYIQSMGSQRVRRD